MIEAKNIYKAFGSQQVLRGLNFQAEQGKITVIMGKSGEGKSVLLKHLIGLIHPDQGEIWIDGEETSHFSDHQWNQVRKKFGMLFQDAALFDYMNVFENVSFPLVEHTTLSEKEIRLAVEEKLEEVGLSDINHKLPSELSGGMRKRVGLARALILDPKILLFDEPTTGLDPIITGQIADLINQTHERHKMTVVVISHDLGLTYQIADSISMIYNGQMVENCLPEDFRRSNHSFVREFLAAHDRADTQR